MLLHHKCIINKQTHKSTFFTLESPLETLRIFPVVGEMGGTWDVLFIELVGVGEEVNSFWKEEGEYPPTEDEMKEWLGLVGAA